MTGRFLVVVKFMLILVLPLFLNKQGLAQLTVVSGLGMQLTPEQLVRDYLVGKGVGISNVTLNGSSDTISVSDIGYFQTSGDALSQLKIETGIIMTTGRASNAIGPNNSHNAGSRTDTGGDVDLQEIAGTNIFDACVIEFDFIPQCDTIKFSYVFGSEEFYEMCGKIDDVFGFFLSGPGINGPYSNNSINIAKMPGSLDYVSINSICADSNASWDNKSGVYFQYDGLTYVFTAWHVITPFQTYHLKLAIGDAIDQLWDSGVFLAKGSFSSGFDFHIGNVPSFSPAGLNAVEGCNDIAVTFTLPQPAQTDLAIEYSIQGTATPGVDYTELSGIVNFRTGHDSASVIIHPLSDELAEGDETVILNILRKTCYDMVTIRDTIIIKDNPKMEVTAGNDLVICPGDTTRLTARVTGGFGPFSFVWNDPLCHDSVMIVYPVAGNHAYIITVTDMCNITLSDTLHVKVDTVAFLTNHPAEKSICDGEQTKIILTSNLTTAFFQWQPFLVTGDVTGYYPGSGNFIDQAPDLQSGKPAEINYHIMITGNGCDTTYTEFIVSVNPLPQIDLGENTWINPGSTIQLHAGNEFASYLWSTLASDSVITVDQEGVYYVEVKNGYGCYASDTILVQQVGLYSPNAFTPNGDGLNDRFVFQGLGDNAHALLQIFNRRGQMIFQTNDPEKGWDGSIGNQPGIPDTYVWILYLGTSHVYTYKGSVTLVR